VILLINLHLLMNGIWPHFSTFKCCKWETASKKTFRNSFSRSTQESVQTSLTPDIHRWKTLIHLARWWFACPPSDFGNLLVKAFGMVLNHFWSGIWFPWPFLEIWPDNHLVIFPLHGKSFSKRQLMSMTRSMKISARVPSFVRIWRQGFCEMVDPRLKHRLTSDAIKSRISGRGCLGWHCEARCVLPRSKGSWSAERFAWHICRPRMICFSFPSGKEGFYLRDGIRGDTLRNLWIW
jgi:hypothetical protein